MAFAFDKLLEDPMAAIGLGLLTSRENPLGVAMQQMQAAAKAKRDKEKDDLDMEYKKAQTDFIKGGKVSGASGGGGATGVLIDRYMQATGASYPEALQAVQTGFRQNMLYQDGKIAPIPGAGESKGDLAGAEAAGKKLGESLGDAKANYGNLESKSLQTINQLKDLTSDQEGFEQAVGRKGWQQGFGMMDEPIPGTKAANFNERLKQIKGATFLDAYQQLRGGGQITEIEGTKAEAAYNRMSTAQDETEFLRARDEFQGYIQAGLNRLRMKVGVPVGEPGAAPQASPASGGVQFLGFEGQ